jgi:metallo-beta-lactamase class B
LGTLGLVCLCTLAVAAQQKFSKDRIEWNKPMTPFHIVGNIYFVGTAGLGSYLITSPQGHILLDGALPESAPQIEQHIAALGFHIRDVKILLNSHAHYDHDGGLHELKRASGAQMVASRGDAPNIESGLTDSYGAGWNSKVAGVKVDRVIDDGAKVTLGGATLIAHITPGHTKGCTTWTMRVADAGKTYDVVFYCSTSVPGYSLVNNRSYPRIASDYRRSFSVLEKLPCDVFLANHTGFFHMDEKLERRWQGGANPFIDPGEYLAFVAQSKAEFETKLQKQSVQ